MAAIKLQGKRAAAIVACAAVEPQETFLSRRENVGNSATGTDEPRQFADMEDLPVWGMVGSFPGHTVAIDPY